MKLALARRWATADRRTVWSRLAFALGSGVLGWLLFAATGLPSLDQSVALAVAAFAAWFLVGAISEVVAPDLDLTERRRLDARNRELVDENLSLYAINETLTAELQVQRAEHHAN